MVEEFNVFGEDYGTSEFKMGPATLGNVPDAVENRGYFPDTSRVLVKMSGGNTARRVVVGPEVYMHLEAKKDVAERMVYPMRNGVIERDDERAWLVIKELTRYALTRYAPNTQGFEGFRCVAALSAAAPRYMYEKMVNIHSEINAEEGRTLAKAITIIPQPLAVAISQKRLACTVLEGGHGNTQVAPISSGMIFGALVTLNRGGSDCDTIAAEILRDAGYADLAREPKLVKLFKEALGLVPHSLERVLQDKSNQAFREAFRIQNTRITIDLGENSWQRFLIGEFFFNPGHEVFSSYYKKGFPKPEDTPFAGRVILGTTDLADVVIESVQKCSFEIQPLLYQNIVLSGGAFSWGVPPHLADYACDAPSKLKTMFESKGIRGVNVSLTTNPAYNVWQGCITYGLYLPEEYEWEWETREGWINLG
ncbi:MAG: hypothetical protein QW429_01970 [Thermoprotei archaeon]